MECLICSEPIRHAHLGVNSCRACAVFYKRSTEAKRQLKCKGGAGNCRTINPKTTCRLCRYTRFNEILKKAGGASESITIIDEEEMELKEPDKSTFINHESFYDCEPSTSETPLLDRLRKGYSLMCLIRHSGEIATRQTGDEASVLHFGKMTLVPASYSTIIEHSKLCKEALKAFASHAFDDFRELDDESKEFIIQTSRAVMNSIDASYRSSHYFPNRDDIRSPGYTTYVKIGDLDKFFANCPADVDAVKISGEFQKGFEKIGKGINRYFIKINPTDYEFLAILGLSLWSAEISNINEKVLKIAMRNRSMIMKELHTYYSNKGIDDYAVRIGNLYCIIVNFQNNVLRLHEDFQLYRLMNLFKDQPCG